MSSRLWCGNLSCIQVCLNGGGYPPFRNFICSIVLLLFLRCNLGSFCCSNLSSNICGGLNNYYCLVHSFFNFLVLRLEHSVFEIIFTATHVNNGIPRLGPCGFALVQEQVMSLAPWNFCSKGDDVCDANYWRQDRLDIHQVQGRPCVIRPMEIRGVLCYESERVGDVVFVNWTEGMGNCIQSSVYVPLPC